VTAHRGAHVLRHSLAVHLLRSGEQGSGVFRECPDLSLIEAVEAEGLGGGGVVAAAFGNVHVAGVLEGCGDGGADGGQVDGPAAGAAGGGIFPESNVADVVVRLDGPLLADQAGQVLAGGLGAGQAGDGVDGLAGDLAGRGVLPPAGDLDGLAGMREVQAADVGGL